MKGDPLETLKKCERKVSQSRKNFLGHGRDSNQSICLADLKKSPKILEAEEATLVWQLVKASLLSL